MLSMTGSAITANVATGAWTTAGGGGGIATDPPSAAALIGVLVSNNQAPGGGNGGGIFNRGNLTMIGGGLRNNAAQSGGGLSQWHQPDDGRACGAHECCDRGQCRRLLRWRHLQRESSGIPTTAVITIGGGSIQSNRALGGGGIFTRANSIVNVKSNALINGNVAYR